MTQEELVERDIRTRDDFWAGIGQVHGDVLAPLLNSAFTGGPKWPNLRQAVRFVHCEGGTIVASDGLSDAWFDYDTNPDLQTTNGIGLEVYLKTRDTVLAENYGWPGAVVYSMAQQAAHLGGQLWGHLENHGIVSFELNDVSVPDECVDRFVSERGSIGILLGGPDEEVPATVALSIEPAKLVKITMLTTTELDYVIENKAEGRELVSDRLQAQYGGYSVLGRESVV